MTELVFDRVSRGSVCQATFRMGPGMLVVLSTSAEAGATLVELAAGHLALRRGSLTLDGKSPASRPSLRQRIGSLFATESLPRAPSVAKACEQLLLAHSVPPASPTTSGGAAMGEPLALMEQWGLGPLLGRRPEQLTSAEQRALCLAVALSLPDLRLLALFEPLVLPPRVDQSSVLALLAQHATRIPVLCAVTSLEAARRLGGPQAQLEGGWLRPHTPSASGAVTLHAEGIGLRHCMELLLDQPGVTAVACTSDRDQRDTLRVETNEPHAASQRLVQASLEKGVRLLYLVLEEP